MFVSLVIPCYEEHERLPRFLPELLHAMRKGEFLGELLVVDDGSRPESCHQLEEFLKQQGAQFPEFGVTLLRLSSNQGKGASIVHGWAQASAQSQWLGFVDADGSASAAEVLRSYQSLKQLNAEKICALFAVRTGEANTLVKRQLWRACASWIFTLMVRLRHRTKLVDSQCGLKWISQASWRCFGECIQERGYRFDLELILYHQFHQGEIHTLPISWSEAKGSKINLGRAAQIFWRALRYPIKPNTN